MAKCASCGKDYNIWKAALGEGICADCSRAQKEQRAKAAAAQRAIAQKLRMPPGVQAVRQRGEEAQRAAQYEAQVKQKADKGLSLEELLEISKKQLYWLRVIGVIVVCTWVSMLVRSCAH